MGNIWKALNWNIARTLHQAVTRTNKPPITAPSCKAKPTVDAPTEEAGTVLNGGTWCGKRSGWERALCNESVMKLLIGRAKIGTVSSESRSLSEWNWESWNGVGSWFEWNREFWLNGTLSFVESNQEFWLNSNVSFVESNQEFGQIWSGAWLNWDGGLVGRN